MAIIRLPNTIPATLLKIVNCFNLGCCNKITLVIIYSRKYSQVMVAHTCNPNLRGRLQQKDYSEFETSLGYRVKSCLKKM